MRSLWQVGLGQLWDRKVGTALSEPRPSEAKRVGVAGGGQAAAQVTEAISARTGR